MEHERAVGDGVARTRACPDGVWARGDGKQLSGQREMKFGNEGNLSFLKGASPLSITDEFAGQFPSPPERMDFA